MQLKHNTNFISWTSAVKVEWAAGGSGGGGNGLMNDKGEHI